MNKIIGLGAIPYETSEVKIRDSSKDNPPKKTSIGWIIGIVLIGGIILSLQKNSQSDYN